MNQVITAKIASTCPACQQPIAVGDRVTRWAADDRKKKRFVHVACSGDDTDGESQGSEACETRADSPDNASVVNDALSGSRGADQQRVAVEIMRWGAMILSKNADYGSSVWKRPVLAPECDPGVAIRVRMSDKIERLMALLEDGKRPQVDESLDDTLRDLGGYCLLELARPGRNREG